jgi:hypothetical protein
MIDPKAFTGELAKRLATHARLRREAAGASEALEAAEDALKAARERDRGEAVAARVAGKDAPAGKHQQEAEAALKAAKWDAEVAHQAMLAAQDQAVTEAAEPEHRKRLDEQEAALAQEAIDALDALEKQLDAVAEVRARRGWLARPVQGDRLAELLLHPVGVVAEGFRKPNGEPGDAKNLTDALRSALRREPERPQHADYGLPVGAKLVGPWHPDGVPHVNEGSAQMSSAAQRVFEEQIAGTDAADDDDE